MAKLTVQEAKEFTLFPPETILRLKIENVRIEERQGSSGPWDKIDFTFTVLGIVAVGGGGNPADYEDAIGTTIYGRGFSANITSHPENRMRLWAEAILNVDLGIGYTIDTDQFLNREVRGITTQYEKKQVNPATGKPFLGQQVDSLLRPGGNTQVQQQPEAPQLQYGQPQTSQPQQQQYQQPQAAPQQQDPWAQPAAAQPPAQPQPQDPWGGSNPWGGDEPPF